MVSQAASAPSDDLSLLTTLIADDETTYYTSWGSSYYLTSMYKQWTMSGPDPTPTVAPPPQYTWVNPNADKSLATDAWTAGLFRRPSGLPPA